MRILAAGTDSEELEAAHRLLKGEHDAATITLVPDIQQLEILLQSNQPTLVLASSSLPGWDAYATVYLCMQAEPSCDCIGLARKGDWNEARALVEAGALDAFPIEQAWRLPLALERARDRRTCDQAADRMRALEILLDSVKQLSLSRRMESIVDVVRRAARRLGQADGATFVLRDGDQCHYVDEDAIGPLWRGKKFPMSACISGWAMMNKRPAVVPDIYADARIPIAAYRPTFVKSLVVVPIRAAEPIGAIGLYWARERAASSEEVTLLQMLADATSLAVENVQAYQDLERRVRERTASLEAVNKELEAFARSVSHDLRSPLAVIVGYSDLLADETRTGMAQADKTKARGIYTAAMRMSELIEDMLRLSQVIQREVEPRPVNLSTLCDEILANLAASAPHRRVETQVEPGLWLMGDIGLMRIAMENLLSNAWKYTSHREHPLIQVGRAASEDESSAFYVRDNGAGFAMEETHRLFKPFQRLHTADEFPGTGVGLATVSRVIEKHGGSIRAEAEKGKGATFTFEVPAPVAVQVGR
jgi:signal transduction histidine kinase